MSLFDTVQIRTDYILGRLTRQQVTELLPAADLADIYIARSPLLGPKGARLDAGLDVTTVDYRRTR